MKETLRQGDRKEGEERVWEEKKRQWRGDNGDKRERTGEKTRTMKKMDDGWAQEEQKGSRKRRGDESDGGK